MRRTSFGGIFSDTAKSVQFNFVGFGVFVGLRSTPDSVHSLDQMSDYGRRWLEYFIILSQYTARGYV